MAKPSAVYLRLPIPPEAVERLQKHAERVDALAKAAPEALRVAQTLYRAAADLLSAVERDLAAATAPKRRRRRKLARRRR